MEGLGMGLIGRMACVLALMAIHAHGAGAPLEWQASFPLPAKEAARGMAFDAAVEMPDGDFVVSGYGWDNYLMRMDSHGTMRWISSVERSESGIQPMKVEALFASGSTLVALRNYWDFGANVDAGLHLERHDGAGKVTSKIRVGTARWAFSGDGGVFSAASPASADSIGRPALSLQKRKFDGSPGWSTVLGGFYAYEVLGIFDRGHSDPLVLCAPLSKGPMDTLFAFGLDAAGNVAWRSEIETTRNTEPLTGQSAIGWAAPIRLPDGRIVAAGIREAVRGIPPGSEMDSLIVLVLQPGNGTASMRGYAVGSTDLEHLGGVGVSELRPSGDQALLAKVQLDAGSGQAAWKEMEIRVGGPAMGSWPAPAQGREIRSGSNPVFLPNHVFSDFGYRSDSIGPEPPIDGRNYPTSVNTAAVFIGSSEGAGEWKTLGLEGFRDTVWTNRISTPKSGVITNNTDFRSLRFLLPTSDGGALAGGRLWTSNSQDTSSIAAVKLGPGFTVGLMPSRQPKRVSTGLVPGKTGAWFDATGRLQRRAIPVEIPPGARFRK
jgi:hypothetical protein